MRKVSISTFSLQKKYGDREAIRIAKEIGADAIDFSTDGQRFDYRNPDSIYSKSEKEFSEYFLDLRHYADELGLEIGQTHGRITGFRNIQAEDEAFVKNAHLDCMAAHILGAPVVIIHNVTTIFMGKDANPDFVRNLNYDMFMKIIPFAKEFNIKIATETFGDATGLDCVDFFGQIREFEDAFNRVKKTEDFKDFFTICVDTGHSNKAMRYGEPTPGDVIRRLGNNISVLHLHDNDTFFDQHKIPMTGTIDWNDVFNALDEVGYSGNYNMEVNLIHFGENFMIEEASFAVKVMKNILKERYGE